MDSRICVYTHMCVCACMTHVFTIKHGVQGHFSGLSVLREEAPVRCGLGANAI